MEIQNIIIAGKNNIAVDITKYLIKEYPRINLFGVTTKTDTGCDGKQLSFLNFLKKTSLNIIELTESYSIKNSLFLSLEFDKIIKPILFSTKKLFNIHFSKLPAYRGVYTSAWPILNGEKISGVTLHKIDSGIDTGDIIAQEEIAILNDETASSLYHKYIKIGTALVKSELPSLINDSFRTFKQENSKASQYNKKSIDYTSLKIDFNQSALQVSRQIRTFTFRCFQLINFRGYFIFGVRICSRKSSNSPPGKVLNETQDSFTISTKDYNIEIFKDKLDAILQWCGDGNLELVKKHLANTPGIVNEKNAEGWSPIIVAAYHGRKDLIKLLLQYGADINDTNYHGTSVLMYSKNYAEKSNDYDFLDFIVSLGADLNHKDCKELNVFDYVFAESCKDCKDYFASLNKDKENIFI